MNKTLAYIGVALLIGGCGSSSSHKKKDVNITDYLPRTNQTKSFLTTRDGSPDLYKEKITVKGNKITIKIDNKVARVYTINESNVTLRDNDKNITATLTKYLNKGDTLYSIPTTQKVEYIKLNDTLLGTKTIERTISCKLEDKLKKFIDYDIKYDGDILKFKCIQDIEEITKKEDNLSDSISEYLTIKNGKETKAYDISYFYMKKDEGLIAYIDDNCTIENKDKKMIVDDRLLKTTKCIETHYTHTFYSN
jgi:hypothetical protein